MTHIESKLRFKKIAEKTGILNQEKLVIEPSYEERDELWDITRVFAERIYKLDIDQNADQDEINELCHFAIVALHWNDLFIDDDRFSYDNGRFRRDTVALAMCFFTRISRNYKKYDSLKKGWILPHTNFSILMWSMTSIIECNTDNLFHLFDKQKMQEAKELFHQVSGLQGDMNWRKVPDEHPLWEILWEIRKRFISSRIPYQFILNYIWSGPDLPGGMGLLPRDREMNKSYLKKQIQHKQFPPDWSFENDIAYVYLFFATETDGTLSESEIVQIKVKLAEWISGDNEDEKRAKVDQAFDSSKSQFDTDASKDRFSFALENIRRHFFIIKEGNRDKISGQLSFVLEDLVAIAKADEMIIQEEYDLVEEIRLLWGIDIKLFDENIVAKFNSAPTDPVEEPKEKETQPSAEYLENYPGELYCENEHWWRSGRPLHISNFPNVFDGTNYQYRDLFRRFTKEEVDMIVNKIKSTGSLIYLNFVRETMSEKFDLRGMKTPFWFIPFEIYGNDHAGLLYFEQNGIYNNCNNPFELSMIVHCDLWENISFEPGYNGLTDGWGYDNKDEDILSSLKIDFIHKGNSGCVNVVETHGNEYVSTLPIVKAIWDNAWKRVIDNSKEAGCFLLGPPPFPEFFNSWEELLKWASSKNDNGSPGESESDSSKEG